MVRIRFEFGLSLVSEKSSSLKQAIQAVLPETSLFYSYCYNDGTQGWGCVSQKSCSVNNYDSLSAFCAHLSAAEARGKPTVVMSNKIV